MILLLHGHEGNQIRINICHCERSEAIQNGELSEVLWIASSQKALLAMTLICSLRLSDKAVISLRLKYPAFTLVTFHLDMQKPGKPLIPEGPHEQVANRRTSNAENGATNQ